MRKHGWRISRLFKLTMYSIVAITVSAGGTWYAVQQWDEIKPFNGNREEFKADGVKNIPAEEVMADKKVEVVLKKTYICGVEGEERLTKNVSSVDQLIEEYQDWSVQSSSDRRIVFHKNIRDISPVCKESGFFGLSEEGILTLYQGVPENKKVIKTFFQIDTKKLESSLPPEQVAMLMDGIRVRDLAEYNSILSTYGEFQKTE